MISEFPYRPDPSSAQSHRTIPNRSRGTEVSSQYCFPDPWPMAQRPKRPLSTTCRALKAQRLQELSGKPITRTLMLKRWCWTISDVILVDSTLILTVRMDRDAVPPCHGPPNIWCKVASVLGNVEVPIGHSIAKSLGPRNREENLENVSEWQEMTRII